MTGPAGPQQDAGPGEAAVMDTREREPFSRPPEAPDTWTADASYAADSPVPYGLTARAEALLAEPGGPRCFVRDEHARGMRMRPPHARPGVSGPADGYFTEISAPPSDNGVHSLYAHMKEPDPEPEAGQ